MSGIFPSTEFAALDFRSNVTIRTTVTISNKMQRAKVGGQYWSFKLQSRPMTRAEFMPIYSFLIKQDGQYESFTVELPGSLSSSRGTAAGTVTISDDYAAGVTNCRSTGGTGTLKKGDLIKFSNHDKVYMITEDINLDQMDSSEDVINFYPALTTAITNTTTVDYTNIKITVMQTNDVNQYQTGIDNKFKYELEVQEVL
jgi:hypothetical protein